MNDTSTSGGGAVKLNAKMEDSFDHGKASTEQPQNHYEYLGLDQAASRQQIAKACANKMREHHPDKIGGVAPRDDSGAYQIETAVEICRTLKDDEKRRAYDKSLESARERMPRSPTMILLLFVGLVVLVVGAGLVMMYNNPETIWARSNIDGLCVDPEPAKSSHADAISTAV
eukprot:CAMPEP_0197662318 /NCGR_PEP_ID=MMETSP1338-20131121/52924_1 /TAXON_ID=43686 ORGANISM="Pelagodinium beii, Strain RCC1491" /NCGR_SAMPLE_ID=MMETSP1338 /ASSEMBLY_ACC=CAM_ASM_000754 /LENGTH=171 /DNA_ID=CAMNT_0043240115 /DNA_START=184 /DNA_END=700 /DNA_ORIENTATION=+